MICTPESGSPSYGMRTSCSILRSSEAKTGVVTSKPLPASEFSSRQIRSTITEKNSLRCRTSSADAACRITSDSESRIYAESSCHEPAGANSGSITEPGASMLRRT